MAIASGSRLGAYEVLALIGAGGMGEVYRARDTKLNRDVALKVLPYAFVADPDRLARFQREAQTLAALNHPNIAHIHGLEDSGDVRALVMELVDGPTLADILAGTPQGSGLRRALPLGDVLNIARQIAEALEAAHETGIIHRDLKPANIKVRDDGTVKVLDFGLAKAIEPAAVSASVSMSPTITTPAMTESGVILGTAAYMSPEQASGKPVDKRSDVWSFGVVLWEMISGRRLFHGETVSHTLADVLRAPIDFSQLPADTPQTLRLLLRRCLNRDVRKRMRDIGDARFQLEEMSSGADEHASWRPSTAATTGLRTRERIAWGVGVVLLALVATGAIVWAVRAVPMPPETRLEITTPATDDVMSFALSPDGRRLVFAAPASDGRSQLWLRSLDDTSPQTLAGTEGAAYPFWSPDSRSVAFFADDKLKRLDIGSQLPQTLVSTGVGDATRAGGSWSSGGVILFHSATGVVRRVPAPGTSASESLTVTKLEAGQTAHRFPHFLPGGRQFLFYARAQEKAEAEGLYLGSLDSTELKRLGPADTSAMFLPPNWLIFVRQGALLAQQVDLARGALTGDPVTVVDQVAFDLSVSAGAFSVSSVGSITYRSGTTAVTQFTWFDRSGKVLGTVGQPDANSLRRPTLSPDGRRVAAYRTVQNNTDVWVFDAARMIRLTFDAGLEGFPLWSPDGSHIAFSKFTKGALNLYQKPSSGAGEEELLLAVPPPIAAAPISWSPDGRFLLYIQSGPATGRDVYVLPLDGRQKPYPFVNSRFEERIAQFSPDGRWVAYQSDESGQPEIYVRPFQTASGRWQVSTMGGVTPRWRADGSELYYIAPDGKLMAVPMKITGPAPEMGTPMSLFQPRILYGGTQPLGSAAQFDVAPDGRFLVNVNITGAAPITLIQNWTRKN